LTVEGKPFEDFIDARNHAEVIDFLYDVVGDQKAISVGLIKEINALLLFGITYTPARTPDGRMVDKKVGSG